MYSRGAEQYFFDKHTRASTMGYHEHQMPMPEIREPVELKKIKKDNPYQIVT